MQRIRARNLCWLPETDGVLGAPEPVAVANRSANLYRFVVEPCEGEALPVPPGSFLRRRQFRRSARSGA